MNAVEYKKDQSLPLLCAPTVGSNLFFLSLFSRISDHGILYSLRANHRIANNEFLLSREKDDKSLVDQVYSEDASVFSSNAVTLLFYQEKDLVTQDVGNFPECRLTSMARESLQIGDMKVTEVQVKFRKTGVFPSQQQLLKLAYILNHKLLIARPFDMDSKCPHPRMLDFEAIISPFSSCKAYNNKTLESFVKKELGWACFQVFSKESYFENMCRLRSFFQCMHPIGISFVEGNHRAVLASKVLYGQPVNLPFPLEDDFFRGQKPIPKNSALFYDKLDVKIVLPGYPKGKVDAESARCITREMLDVCQSKSRLITANKKLFIEENWKSFFQTVMERCNNVKGGFRPVSLLHYQGIEMPYKLIPNKHGRSWNTTDMFDRKTIAYVDKTYQTVEILAECSMEIEPMATII
jgi:hypothetical protein